MIKKHLNQNAVKDQWEVYQNKAKAVWKSYQKEIVRTTAGVVVACIVSVGGAAMIQPNAYAVSYNGELLGYVEDTALMDAALQAVKDSVSQEAGV